MSLAEVYTLHKVEEDGLGYLGITIDKTRDKDLSEQAYKLLKDYYCKSDEDSPQQAFIRGPLLHIVMETCNSHRRIYDAVSKGWFMFASPVLSNAPH